MSQHAPDFPVFALGEAQLDPTIRAGAPLEIGVDRAIADTFDRDSFSKTLQLLLADPPMRTRAIGANNAGARKLELALDLSIIRKQQQPFGRAARLASNAGVPAAAGRRLSAGPWHR